MYSCTGITRYVCLMKLPYDCDQLETMKTVVPSYGCLRILCMVGGWILGVTCASAEVSDFQSIDWAPGDLVEMRFRSDNTNYYLVEQVIDWDVGFTNHVMVLGEVEETTFQEAASAERGWFRVRPLNPADSLDTDGDGMPDLYELARFPLNPVDPNDGAISTDADTLSNLEEYQAGTDPLKGDSDGDGFGDDDELADGSLPLDPASLPIDPSWTASVSASFPATVVNQATPATDVVAETAVSLPLSILNQAPPATLGVATEAVSFPLSIQNTNSP